jgi:hypothetical protein
MCEPYVRALCAGAMDGGVKVVVQTLTPGAVDLQALKD